MRAVLQRVRRASVCVAGQCVGRIDHGLLILLGVHADDADQAAAKVAWLSQKVAHLRVFEDDAGKMNRSLLDVGGAALVVSQFTLYADCEAGRRPSFAAAARPEVAEPIYERFVQAVQALGVPVQTGRFGADMQVELLNDGPVTLVVDR